MEIFQTIWIALTTENETLTNMLFLPVNAIETILNMLIFTTLLNIKCNKSSMLKYIIISSLELYLSGLFIPNPYRSYINLILSPIIIWFCFKPGIIKSIISAILPIFVTVLCESIITKAFSSIIDFNSLNLVSIPIYRISVTLGIQLLVFIIYLLIKYFKIHTSLFEELPVKSKRIFILNFIFAILAILIQFLITGFYLDKLPIYIVLFSNLSLIAYFILSIYSLTKTTKLELTSLNLEQEKENNRILKALQDDLRGFRHDFSNIMCTISRICTS